MSWFLWFNKRLVTGWVELQLAQVYGTLPWWMAAMRTHLRIKEETNP